MPSEESQLRSYAEPYLVCRALRSHAWIIDERTKKRASKSNVGSYVLVLGCGRCNMVRIDSRSYRGALLARSYRAPDGYALDFTPTAEQMIRELFLRDERESRKVSLSR
jgi:hypothetical protein